TFRLSELDTTEVQTKVELTDKEREEAINYLKKPKLMDRLYEDISKASEIVAEKNNAILLYTTLVSKKLKSPLSAIIFGESGSGKTTLLQGIGNLLPKEDVITLTSLSKTSLYYMDDLIDKSLLIEDLSGASSDDVLFALRELVSNQKLSRNITERNHKGDIVSKIITLKTQLSMASCTTNTGVYFDNQNRSIPILIESWNKEREEEIFKYKQLKASGKINTEEIETLKQTIVNAHRVLQDVEVINPYADKLNLPESVKSPKRSFQLYLDFIKTIAWLNQYSRKVKTDKKTKKRYIEVNKEDIKWANRLLKDALLIKSDDLSSSTRKFYNELKDLLKESRIFTIKDIKHLSHMSNIKRYLKELRTYEFVRITNGNQHTGFEYKLIEDTSWNNIEKELENSLNSQVV
ncbi:MAG: ATP-binding protein, partial [Candidatus Caenarcaniphilales bacterium]|nr:ATP-binding protein [Candidatus Caenarcaniphilales bacterium]